MRTFKTACKDWLWLYRSFFQNRPVVADGLRELLESLIEFLKILGALCIILVFMLCPFITIPFRMLMLTIGEHHRRNGKGEKL